MVIIVVCDRTALDYVLIHIWRMLGCAVWKGLFPPSWRPFTHSGTALNSYNLALQQALYGAIVGRAGDQNLDCRVLQH